MAYIKTNWENNVTPINDDNLNKIEEGIYENSLKIDEMGDGVIKLLSITEEPTTFQEKDKYYNSDDDLIFEAVDSSTWDNGTTPSDTAIYLNEVDNKLYRYYNHMMNLLADANIPIQDTAPQNPEENDLWVDTSSNNSIKYYNGSSWEQLGAKATNISNTSSNSQEEAYGCDFMNQIGEPIEMFGDVGGDKNNAYNFHCIGKVVATKISTDGIWKFDIQSPITFNNGSADYFTWGIMPSKISALLNDKIGVQVQYDSSLRKSCVYKMFTTTGGYDYSHVGYGSLFEWSDGNYLLFARYYTEAGAAGGWTLDSFTSGQQILATIYLREV